MMLAESTTCAATPLVSWTLETECDGRPLWNTLVTDIDEGLPEVVRSTDCNNCFACETMDCVRTPQVSWTDSGTVSLEGSVSVGVQAALNVRLAGEIGIETTAQFTAGLTRSSRVTHSDTLECGTTELSACARVRYYVERDSRPGSARVKVQWQQFYRCDYGPGHEPRYGPWEPLSRPCKTSWAQIIGAHRTISGCRSEQLPCSPGGPTCCDG